MAYRDGASMLALTKVTEGSWKEVIGDRKLQSIILCEYGFAEEVIAMMEFVDGSFEVGIGESLRPYKRLYEGMELEEATKSFLEALREHSWDD